MPDKKMSVTPKARPVRDEMNRPKTPIPGMTKKSTRMEPALTDKEAKKAKKQAEK